MEQQLNQMYPLIAQHIIGMIPDGKWNEIYLYAEIIDGSREVYFYFNTSENEEFVYSHDIPDKYSVSEMAYDDLLLELQRIFSELRQIFIDNDQKPWTNLTFTLKSPGKMKIHYDYEDVINSEVSPTQRQMIFEYKHLGLFPSNEKDRKFVEDYVKSR
ncbi:DUF600 family protein [Paenibacillus nanensis]|uniref:DUF600 family protein n=1 Tax=Paenibacillus nanensis TaxID=393251 RepID=A0A3A1UUE8_9BACL|nr:antitoxin YezG family protein [Paenibacillus nanensis]RIX50802.1 DUF600 family protein [Paenibacillus nanensis]